MQTDDIDSMLKKHLEPDVPADFTDRVMTAVHTMEPAPPAGFLNLFLTRNFTPMSWAAAASIVAALNLLWPVAAH